ncbi:MAG: enoyl-CoA hydratase/isomerase family protein [Pseudomonadota bacterium]
MIRSSREGHVATITLADPDRHNALDQTAIAALIAQLDDIAQSDARCLVLTGEGKTFCAGARLDQLTSGALAENPFAPLCERLEAFRLPTIAALQGSVFGAGVELALACDFRIGVEGMKATVPAAEFGIHYTQAGIARVVSKLGPQMARRVFLMAERFEAESLLAAGYLDELVTREDLERETAAMAQRLAALAPLAVQGMKASILAATLGGATAADTSAAEARIRACFDSADHREGMAARAEKRAPVFKAR